MIWELGDGQVHPLRWSSDQCNRSEDRKSAYLSILQSYFDLFAEDFANRTRLTEVDVGVREWPLDRRQSIVIAQRP